MLTDFTICMALMSVVIILAFATWQRAPCHVRWKETSCFILNKTSWHTNYYAFFLVLAKWIESLCEGRKGLINKRKIGKVCSVLFPSLIHGSWYSNIYIWHYFVTRYVPYHNNNISFIYYIVCTVCNTKGHYLRWPDRSLPW